MIELSKVKTGVIGTGAMGSNHARVLSEISSLQGITDVDKEVGELVSKKHGTFFYENMFDLLEKVDAVCVAVPTEFHFSIIKEIIKYNNKISILVEKPLAYNLEQCKQILDLANQEGVKIHVGHIERFNPIVLKIKDLIDSGTLGKIISISTKRVSPIPVRIRDVGVVMDLAIHDIDVARHLVSKDIIKVSASNVNNTKGIETHSNLLLSFKNGVSAICEVSWNTPVRIREISLTCENYYVRGDYAKQELDLVRSDTAKESGFTVEKMVIKKEEPLRIELQNFLKSTTNQTHSSVSIEEATEAVRIAHKALTSEII